MSFFSLCRAARSLSVASKWQLSRSITHTHTHTLGARLAVVPVWIVAAAAFGSVTRPPQAIFFFLTAPPFVSRIQPDESNQ